MRKVGFMCRDVTIDYVHMQRVACAESWNLGLWTYQPGLMAKAEQDYRSFLYFLLQSGNVGQQEHDALLDDWHKERANILEVFNNGS